LVKKEHLIGLGAFAALLCLMVILYSASKQGGIPVPAPGGGIYTSHGSQAGQTIPIQVSDPSFLPKGSFLWVTFSNATVYSQSGEWQNRSGYGPVNLAAQVNQSVTVSMVTVPYNSVLTGARLGIKSAFIIVNGVRHNLTISGDSITANMSGVRFGSGKALLLSISPFLIPTSASAHAGLGYSSRSYVVNSSGGYLGQFNQVKLATAESATPYANISIENAVIAANGGATTVRITVVNHSNKAARIGSIAVLGSENLAQNASAIAALSTRYADAIAQKYLSSATSSNSSGSGVGSDLVTAMLHTSASGASAALSTAVYSKALQVGSNLTSIIYTNVSAVAQLAGPIPKAMLGPVGGLNVSQVKSVVYQNIYSGLFNASSSGSDLQSNIASVGFTPSQDGSMEPSWGTSNDSYYLQPNSSVTLDYSGDMQLDNTTSMGLVPDSSYQVVLAGDNGTSASYDVNSTD
jgi:hypothetical protein